MNENSRILRDHINDLSDEELTALLTVDREHYRDEAVAFAEAELRRRGLSVAPGEYVRASGAQSFFAGDWKEPQPEKEAQPGSAPPHVHTDGARVQALQVQALHHAAFKVFRGAFVTWDELFVQAAEFINQIGPERVISISHSADSNDGVVAVWYWT
jgi:hypothetical protein